MIKNLIYGALAATGVGAVVVTVVMDSEPEQSHNIEFHPNGGAFAKSGTWTNEVNLVDCISNVLNDVSKEVVYTNHDLLGWTVTSNGTDFVVGSAPVTDYTNKTLYAKWSIEKHNVTNVTDLLSVFDGDVAQFPVVFYGTAEWDNKGWQYPVHKISFVAPTNDDFRLSFDPQTSTDARAYGVKLVVSNTVSGAYSNHTFGYSKTYPVDFASYSNRFEKGVRYDLTLNFGDSKKGTINYALCIGLDGVQVKFDPTDSGNGYFDSNDARRFWLEGANYTDCTIHTAKGDKHSSYGALAPDPKTDTTGATFAGWYTAPDEGGVASGVKVEATSAVLTNETLYAHWTYKNFDYYVEFGKGAAADAEGEMPMQKMTSGNPAALYRNCYFAEGRRFCGWTSREDSSAFYVNGQTVTNLCSRPNATNHLEAIWEPIEKGRYYVVIPKGRDVFKLDDALTNLPVNVESVGVGSGVGQMFCLDVTNMTNSANCRVSIDPVAGANRTKGLTLYIDRWISTNGWAGTTADAVGWQSNVCSATEFEVSPTSYQFTNGVYRFRVSGVASNESYIVGIDAKGYQIDYDSCGVQDMSFNWTVDTPYGYFPTLTSSTYGKHLGWFYNKDITDTNEVSKTESVVSNATVYAHWANQPYTIRFDGSSATSPSPYVQDFRYGQSQALRRNQFYLSENKFMGWATNCSNVVVYEDGATVTNLCTIAGGTNTLYAVWDYTPGTNWYYVAGVMTNFQNISFTQGQPTLFVGMGDMTQFMVTTTNVSKCRVAIDPQEGFLRTGAKLTIDCAEIPTNKTEKLEWESACTVTDLADKEVTCSFTTNHYYRFTVSGVANTNGYVVSVGAEGARYVFDVCGGNFVGEEETTKVKFYNWTVGSAIAYDPPVTTNAYVHGSNTWQYTPQYLLKDVTNKVFSVTNVVVSGGEKLYAHWSDALIVPIIFNWNPAVTNVVLTNYYAHGANVYLYQDAYVRQPTSDGFGFLGWTTNETTVAGWDFKLEPVETNHFLTVFYAQWTKEWKTSRTEDGGLSIDGYYTTPNATLEIPEQIKMLSGALWPMKVTAIGDSAFAGCTAFSTLNIHSGVTSVGDSAFEDCTALTTVTFEETEMPDEYATEGFLDGVIDPDSPSVELGECLFKGCTSLKDVDLPLGVNCIPDECFSGCTAMTAFTNMPYTVIEIGDEAFAGCTHLTHVTHTEVVDAIGSGAFKKCARLRFVNFLGDQPSDVASDIFEKTQRNVLVRYLANMCTTAKDYCGGTWSALPATWPSGDYARTLTWLNGKYPRRKVIFNYNDKETPLASTKVPVLYHAGRVFGLLAPTEDEMNNAVGVDTSDEDDDEDSDEVEEEEEEAKSGFSGWYTQPMGGRKVGNYWEVPTASEGDSAPITVYAHWGDEKEAGDTEVGSRGSEEYPVSWPGAEGSENDFDTFTGFYSADDDMFYYSASAFNGVVFAVDDNMVTGTVAFAFKDGVYTESDGMQSAFTATVTWNNGKTTTVSGVADAEGYLISKSSRWSFGDADDADENRTFVTKSGIYGWLTDEDDGTTFRIYAARNRTAQTTTSSAAKTVVLTGLQATKGTWHVVFEATADGEGEAFAVGYSTLAITIANMGQATITGTLGDGTAVSTTATLIIGDGCCCLPVSIRPYGGKGGFSFMLWFAWQSDGSFGEDDASIQGLTEWDASMSSHPFTATLTPKPLTFIDDKLCTDEKDFKASDEVLATITMKGKTWTIPTGEDNPYKLTLSYDYKSGIFSGSFVDPDDATRRAVVNGVFTDRINEDLSDTYTGYGTAVIKDEGSYPVVIGEED